MPQANERVCKWCEDNATERDKLIAFARLAETAQRYNDMAEAMNSLLAQSELHGRLTDGERALLSVAYKHVLDPLRDSWRIARELVPMAEHGDVDADRVAQLQHQKDTIAADIQRVCGRLLVLTRSHLASGCEDTSGLVFFHKMSGDYERYLAEIDDGTEHVDAARSEYKQASEIAKGLAATDPVRLGLKLNMSVFFYEILKIPDKAAHVAKDAFDAAIADLESVPAHHYRDTTLLLQLLRDNLALWTDGAEYDISDVPALK